MNNPHHQFTLDGEILRDRYFKTIQNDDKCYKIFSKSLKKNDSHVSDINRPHIFEFITENNERVTDVRLELVIWCNEPVNNKLRCPLNNFVTSYGAKLPTYDNIFQNFTASHTKIPKIENNGSFQKTKFDLLSTKLYKEMLNPVKTGIPYKMKNNSIDNSKYLYIFQIADRLITYYLANQPSRSNELIVPDNVRFADNLHFTNFILNNFIGSNYRSNNFMKFGGTVNDPYTSSEAAKNNKSLEFSDNKIKNAINILINESNSLISSTKYTLLEKFAFYKLISESLLISMVRNDGSIINYDASIISPIHAMMKKLIVAMGNNYDVLDLLMQTIDLFYDDDNVYDSSLFLTKEFITFVNKLRIIKDNASSELNVLTPFGKSVDAINKSPRKDIVYNSLITPMKELLLAEYNDIEKTYKKYTMPLINENDLLKIDIANMVESISFIHSEVIDVKITGDDLKCLFGSDLVQIHAVVKNNNGNVEQAFCSLRMGLTSDFRTNPNIPLLFDIGRFTATINFKSELLVTHHLNPIKIQSYISYESVMFGNEHTISESIRIGEMIYNIIDLYRVPIPHKFNITTGNGKNPFDLLIPINKYGLSFARALSISKPIYSTKQTLGNLATYDIMIGNSDDQYSKNLLYNTNEKKFTNHDNETYTIYMGNAAMLFSGQHSGSKNICINFKKTDASRALKIETSNDYIVIPLVEFLLKKSISQSIPGRSFKLIKQAQANIND